MTMGRDFAVVMVAALVLSGCVNAADVVEPSAGSDTPQTRVPVIAILDSGTNPYNSIFRSSDTSAISRQIDGFQRVNISQDGTLRERLDHDLPLLETLEPNTLYHYAGTRLLTISVDEETRDFPSFDAGHGQATSYLAARDAPEAIIVLVQVDLSVCQETVGCVIDPSIADGMEWVSQQPWIDIVSVSLGFPGNPPFVGPVHPDIARYLAASKKAADDGKIIVTATGNYVTPPVTSFFSGPPWILAVGGTEGDSKGENVIAGKTFDVSANFSEQVPTAYDDETLSWQAGTSLGTPIVAATLATAARAIWKADPLRSVTTEEVRRALNLSAHLFSATDWDPTPRERGDPIASAVATTLPALTPAQTGWGHVDSRAAAEIARRILDDDFHIPADKAAVEMYQAQWQAGREAYWADAPN